MTEVDISFARGQWDPSHWVAGRSPRWDYTNPFEQLDDHITNKTPADWSDEELYTQHTTEVYASQLYNKQLGSGTTVSSTMSFDHLMAPLIVLSPDLKPDAQGCHTYGEHYEVVLYNEGVNVWHHTLENGVPNWHLAAFARAPFQAKTRYELKVKMLKAKREMRMIVNCGPLTFGFEDPHLPETFYAGITGCEGRNRFYDFKIETSAEKFNAAADGEH